MAAKVPREEETVMQALPRCLLIVFREKRGRKGVREGGGDGGCGDAVDNAGPIAAPKLLTGKELFDSFQTQNKNCFWNPHLEESVKNLRYGGCLAPGTLVVHGRDIYLDTVKAAWARRVLRAPSSHVVARVGEIGSLEMTLISQTQFTPLPEALCIVISELDQDSKEPSLDAILTRLQDKYRGVQQPSEQIVYETLGSLIKERKIYHTGNGYQIVTPESYQNGCIGYPDSAAAQLLFGETGSNGQRPAIYIPVFPGNKASEMCSVSCQTAFEAGKADSEDKSDKGEGEKKVEETKETKSEKESKKSRLDRSHSLRGKSRERKEKADAFQRSASLRYGEDKSREMVKDINLKTSNVHQDKDKGEKQSLFNKLFGRKDKSDKSEQATSKARGAAIEEQTEKEYATFSAQFPPPEWNWYEKQVTQILHSQHVPRSQTWHSRVSPPRLEIHSDPEDEPVTRVRGKVRTLPVGMGGHPRQRCHSISSQSQESRSSSKDSRHESPHAQVQVNQSNKCKKPRHKSEKHKKNGSKQKHQAQDQYGSPEHPLPYPDESLKPGYSSQIHAGQNHKVPGYRLHENPVQTSTPINGNLHGQQYSQDDVLNNGHARDHGFDHSQSHTAHQKYREVTCPGLYGDISVEYCGKLPKKGAMFSMSRDSGVNCVGMTDSGGCLQGRSQPQHSSPTHPNNLTILHNQTGNRNCQPVTSPKYGTCTGHNNNLMVEAQVHSRNDSHQDSGFSSPRTDTDNSNNQQQPNSAHGKLNNFNNAGQSHSRHFRDAKSPQITGNGKHPGLSMESLHITGSEKYASYNQLTINDNEADVTASSSSMSRNTVIDLFPNGDCTPRRTHHSRKDMSPVQPMAVRKEPYTEIQVMADRSHSQTDEVQRNKVTHGARQLSKNKSSQKHAHRDKSYPTHWEQTAGRQTVPSQPANGHYAQNVHPNQGQTQHVHNRQNGVSRRSQRDRMDGVASREHQHQPSPHIHSTHPNKTRQGSDPRLAYLGDVQVVGVV